MKLKRKVRFLVSGLLLGVMLSSTVVSAETRSFKFHMNTNYAHGNTPNRGYAATKADNEQNAYITVTGYDKGSQSPTVTIWVAKYGSSGELTYPRTWTSPKASGKIPYRRSVSKGDYHWLCLEQFGGGSVVVSGRWTP